ncbi:hypothetical protein [Gulosibacter sp. 10]|uniref:hypothetical protein n=1 Tax=Gulosibacter sp. 10 TaxID=1255570 RepID=UPI00097E94C4|nr:hypothetical protein [Gulosibacter sp. 10]SJM54512.1 hypothetical protein FM112_03580 [Gulosibacter sp. 10]
MGEQVNAAPRWPLPLVGGLIAVEAVGMLAVAAFLAYETLTRPSLSVASSIALVVLALIGAAFLAAVVVGLARGQAWSRSGGIVWQVLQTAVAVVILQGDMADAIGWSLAAASLCVLLLMFHPAVTQHLRRD